MGKKEKDEFVIGYWIIYTEGRELPYYQVRTSDENTARELFLRWCKYASDNLRDYKNRPLELKKESEVRHLSAIDNFLSSYLKNQTKMWMGFGDMGDRKENIVIERKNLGYRTGDGKKKKRKIKSDN